MTTTTDRIIDAYKKGRADERAAILERIDALYLSCDHDAFDECDICWGVTSVIEAINQQPVKNYA